jgi:hypothetical protein
MNWSVWLAMDVSSKQFPAVDQDRAPFAILPCAGVGRLPSLHPGVHPSSESDEVRS